jgi:hypothetical protein
LLRSFHRSRAICLSEKERVWLALCVTLGFVVPFYSVGYSAYGHGPDATICAWLAWSFIADSSLVLQGALLALALLFRMNNLLWLAWPIWLAWATRRDRSGPTATRVAGVAALGLLGFAPFCYVALAHPAVDGVPLYWKLDFFSLTRIPGGIWTELFEGQGLFIWTLIAVPGTIGLLSGLVRPTEPSSKRHLTGILIVMALMTLLFASVPDPAGSDAFGARRMSSFTGPLAIGLSLMRERLLPYPVAHRLLNALLLMMVITNLLLVHLAIQGTINLQQYL